MDCQDITQPPILLSYFLHADPRELNRVFKCLYALYFDRFKHFIIGKYGVRDEELINDGFDDGLLAFFHFVRDKKLHDGVSVQTALFSICRNKFLELYRNRYGRAIQITPTSSGELEDKDQIHDLLAVMEAEEELRIKIEKIRKAVLLLDERCRHLLHMRKLLKLGDDEIAQKRKISPNTVSSAVHRCFNQLYNLVWQEKPADK